MLIAVATKSGTEVDQHFGHAERFLIYELVHGEPKVVDEVQVEKYCSFDPDQPLRTNRFAVIVQALKGCRAVVTAQIGDYPRQELEKAGLAHITAVGPIDQVLEAVRDTLGGCGGIE